MAFKPGENSDIAISTRVRIARNLQDTIFSQRADVKTLESVCLDVCKAIINSNSYISNEFNYIYIGSLGEEEKQKLIEKHLISPNLALKKTGAGALINKSEQISIMVNEEDHIRIQCILPGLTLEDAYDMADKVDDLLEENIHYAFDDKLCYLTACPTNLGTGVRMSVMLHLPAMALTNNIISVLRTAGRYGLTIRGIYGEGTESMGDLYQISNQNSLGMTENEILLNVKAVTKGVIKRERELRGMLFENDNPAIKDKIMRSYGVLMYAEKIDIKEAMQLLSIVRLGADMGILKDIKIDKINDLIKNIHPALLRDVIDIDSAGNTDIKRAEYIKSVLNS